MSNSKTHPIKAAPYRLALNGEVLRRIE